jgi:multidrug efflux pump subunit AcrA (membrane-fusion protein)
MKKSSKIPGFEISAQEIELRSEQLNELLGQVPRWIVRNGTLTILLVLIVLVISSILLSYPDIIHTRVLLTTETPPAEVVANKAGRISLIQVSDKAIVMKNQVIAVLESAASFDDMQKISVVLDKEFILDSLVRIEHASELKLGPVQSSYASLLKKLQEYSSFTRLNYHQRKIVSVNTELKKYVIYLERMKEQEKVLQKDLRLAQKQYSRDSLLYIDRVISSSQLEKSEAECLQRMFEWKETQKELASAQIDMSNLQQEILELELKYEESSRQLIQSMQEECEKLKGEILVWDQQYVFRAPFNGQVSFTKIWSENQYVEQGEIVVTVIPLERGSILGKAEIPAAGSGKVKEGHRVVIRLDNYPYLEYGTVSGHISSLSLVPNNEAYSAEIRLDSSGLTTNYNILLKFQQNMSGNAAIITNNRNMLDRIVDPFRSAVNRQRVMNN